MTRNPYAHTETFEAEPVSPRVSVLAVASLVFGILCCVPTFGLIALILGGAGMVAISRSEGRLTGRGLALAGMILGLIGTIFTAVAGFITLQGVAQVQSLSGSYSFVEQKDYKHFRELLTTSASQQLTDDQIEEFHQKVNAAWGKNIGATKGLGEFISGYQAILPRMQGMQPTSSSGQGVAFPVPMRFEKGTAPAVIELDGQQKTTRGTPAIDNIMVMDQGGQAIWLIPPAGGSRAPSVPPTLPAPGTPPEGGAPPP
jgi:hypothetical protein